MITLATYITIFRIILIAPIIYLLFNNFFLAAGLLVAVAGITDFLDGYIARRYHQESTLGALLDPMADKLFILSTFTALWYCYPGLLPAWFIIFLWVKETFLSIGALYMLYNGFKPAQARFSGKIALILQLFYGLLLFFEQYTKLKIQSFLAALLIVVTAVTLYALIDYVKVGCRIFFINRKS